jgi:uncharacterized membrane protein
MNGDTESFLLALLAMGCAAYACRVSGFLLMGFVRITPRLEAALKAVPLAVMLGIIAPVAAKGRPPELAALLVITVLMRVMKSDVAAALAGVATVAAGRALGL